ncbi:MAG: hypothetical protein KBD52_03410 [Candidatus Pacebacteria bacterium]|nr:hypothetical protein [Candidatus Paceibacterota bacterium]
MNGKIVLEVKYENLDQYDEGVDEEMEAKRKIYEPLIGRYLMLFSVLEHILDIEIANLINERGYDQGYIVIKDLEVGEKIELLYNLSFPLVFHSPKRANQKMKQLNLFKTKLESVSILRNKIAHAKWYTLDKEGYIRIDTKTNKENGLIKFRKFRITPSLIQAGIKEINFLVEKLVDYGLDLQSF